MNNRFIFVLCFPILIVSLTVATYGLEGQQTGEFQIKYVETEEFPLNYIYYTVKDHNGNYAEDMYLDHIVLKENKLEHEPFKIEDDIKSFPVVVSLIIDSSGSMKRVMSDVKEAAKYFVDKVNKNIKILPIDFDSEVRPLCPLSDDQEELKKQIDKIKADGGTALYDSIKEGCQKIKDFKGFRAVLVLTDGKDENRTNTGPGSKIDLDTLKENISPLNIPVYSIGLGDGVDEKVLKDMEGKFAFTLANIKKNKALYTSVLPKVNNGMPDMVRVSDNRLVYLTVDHNLFGFDQDGNEMFFWNRDEMGRRVNDISITNDGKFGIAWLDMGGIDRAIAPEWEVVLFDKSGMIIKGKSTKGLGQRNRVSISPDGEYYGFNSRKGPRVYRFSDDELVFSKEVEVKKSEWENFIDIAEDKSIVYNIRSRIFVAFIEVG